MLKRDLEELTGAFYGEAPGEAAYPYAVFSVQRLTEEGGKSVWSMEINVWDRSPYYSEAERRADILEEKLHGSHVTENFLIRIFKGKRQNVPDPDRDIKRVRELFEMQVYEREG